jgi:hypothetical protein
MTQTKTIDPLVLEFFWLQKYSHFEQRPATILEFIGKDYLNIEANVRPILKQILIDIFGTETNTERIALYERAIFTGGIGVGKTTLASIVIPYMTHWVLCLKDPQQYFGLMPGSRIAFMQMSTSEAQAKEVVFGDIKARIDNSPWFRNNYHYNDKFKNQFRFEQKDIWIIPGDSAETTFEGYNILGGILDEADSHKITKNKDYAEQGYTTIHGRVTSRFGDKGFLLVVGQMKKASGFAAKMYRDMRQDPKAYTALLTIWESFGWPKYLNADGTRNSFWYDTQRYEFTTKELAQLQGFPEHILEVPRIYERDFLNSPQKALRDLAGRPPAVNSPLFHDPSRINDARSLYTSRYGNFVPVDSNNHFHDGFVARNSVPRVGHIDIAFSPEGDALGLALAHVAEMVKVDGERKPFIVFDFVMRIQAPPGREIFLGDIRQIIYDLMTKRKFRIKKISTDGFQSTDMRQQFGRRRILTEIISADKSTLPYYDLHDAIVEDRVAIPPYMVPESLADPSLIDIVYRELSQLQDEGMKIDHPPDGSKDVADAIACTVSSIMGDLMLHRGHTSASPITDSNIDRPASVGPHMALGHHPALVGDMPRAPIPPRIETDPTQWRPPTRR